MPLQVGERAPHHGVGDHAPQRTGHEAARIDVQVELGPRAPAVEAHEAPLPGELPEVAAEILAGDPVRLLVDLAQAVADALDARVDLELDDAAAAVVVALQDVDAAHRALPLREALEVGHRVEARLRWRVDLSRLHCAVSGHAGGLPDLLPARIAAVFASWPPKPSLRSSSSPASAAAVAAVPPCTPGSR